MKRAVAVVFDIDGTLAPEVSWLALTRDLGASVERHIQIYTDYKEGKTDYVTSKAQLVDLWRATGNANRTFFVQLFDALPLDSDAQWIVQLAKMDRVVCVITGSMDLYAQAVSRKLGIEHWYANTRLHWDDQGNLVDMDYELDQAGKKLEQYLQFCEDNNLDKENILVLGDGENDEKLFEVCKQGVLISGGSDGETHARTRITRLADFEQILRKN